MVLEHIGLTDVLEGREGRNQGWLAKLEKLGSWLGHYPARTSVDKPNEQLALGISNPAKQWQSRVQKAVSTPKVEVAPRTPGSPSPGPKDAENHQTWEPHLQSPDKALPFYLGFAGRTVPKCCEVHIHRDTEGPERGTPPKCAHSHTQTPQGHWVKFIVKP